MVLTLTKSEVRVPVIFEFDEVAVEACCANVGCEDELPKIGSCFAAGVVSSGLSGATPPGGFDVGARLLLLDPPGTYSFSKSGFL